MSIVTESVGATNENDDCYNVNKEETAMENDSSGSSLPNGTCPESPVKSRRPSRVYYAYTSSDSELNLWIDAIIRFMAAFIATVFPTMNGSGPEANNICQVTAERVIASKESVITS